MVSYWNLINFSGHLLKSFKKKYLPGTLGILPCPFLQWKRYMWQYIKSINLLTTLSYSYIKQVHIFTCVNTTHKPIFIHLSHDHCSQMPPFFFSLLGSRVHVLHPYDRMATEGLTQSVLGSKPDGTVTPNPVQLVITAINVAIPVLIADEQLLSLEWVVPRY